MGVNREKVIKGLEICSAGEWNSTGGRNHTDCPYYPAGYTGCTCKPLMLDALALLRAQEQVEPKEVIYDEEHRSVYCPACNNRLAGLTYSGAVALETEETPNYCWMCGQAVKWN
jgi:hypothetical protein